MLKVYFALKNSYTVKVNPFRVKTTRKDSLDSDVLKDPVPTAFLHKETKGCFLLHKTTISN
jgi:hypothetical protein